MEHNLITKRQLDYCLSLCDQENQPNNENNQSSEKKGDFICAKARQCDPLLPVCIILTMVHEATQADGLLAKSAHKASDIIALKKLEQLQDEEEDAEKDHGGPIGRSMSFGTKGRAASGVVVGGIRLGDSGVAGMKEADLVVKSITDLRERMLGVMLFVDVQLPMPFIQIVSAVVWTFMIQV